MELTIARTALFPYYDLAPGSEQNELIVNIIIYTMVTALIGALLWLAALFVITAKEERTRRLLPPAKGEAEARPPDAQP